MIAACAAQANCLIPTPGWYGRLWANIPDPIIKANVPSIDIQPPRETRFIKAGVLKTPTAAAAEIPKEAPKYKYVSRILVLTYSGHKLKQKSKHYTK